MDKQTIDKFREARDLVAAGFVKGSLRTNPPSGTCYCAFGALAYSGLADTASCDPTPATTAFADFVAKSTGSARTSDFSTVYRWNDDVNTSKADVVKMFDDFIAEMDKPPKRIAPRCPAWLGRVWNFMFPSRDWSKPAVG